MGTYASVSGTGYQAAAWILRKPGPTIRRGGDDGYRPELDEERMT